MKRWIALLAVILILIAVVLLTRGPDPPKPNPPGTFSFAVMGDAPYYVWEDLRFRIVLQDLDAHDLTSVVSVGDIFWQPCSDAMYRRTLDWFNGLRHPVLLTPGDNEWFDCWERGAGGYKPQERLARMREIFYTPQGRSMGGRRIPVVNQQEFIENVRWMENGMVFATVHLIGSWNGREAFPGRTSDDDAAVTRRTEAAATWLREAFAEAKRTNAWAVAVFLHGPLFERPQNFGPFATVLAEEASRFGGQVLVAHGDDHRFRVDHPLRLPNLTRLEVPGSPDVGWVRVVVTPRGKNPFAFESRVVPRWKYW
jgi:hypothetical protein